MHHVSAGAHLVRANEYRRERWRNGLGWTREIASGQLGPADGSDDWDWRLSVAEIECDAAFSAFPGIDRELVLLRGNGLRLRFDDGEVRELQPPHERLRFAGERAVTGELLDGPTHDFNLMWRRARVDAALWHRPLVGPMIVFAEPGSLWLAHLLAGQADLERPGAARHRAGPSADLIEAGDTVFLPGADTRQRYVIDGGGEALLIRLQPAVAPA